MAWWSWLLIWTFLVLGMLAMFALLGWRLFRKATLAYRELSALLDRTGELATASAALADERFPPAALRTRAAVLAERYPLAEENARRQRIRRDERLARGKMLVSIDASRKATLHAQ